MAILDQLAFSSTGSGTETFRVEDRLLGSHWRIPVRVCRHMCDPQKFKSRKNIHENISDKYDTAQWFEPEQRTIDRVQSHFVIIPWLRL